MGSNLSTIPKPGGNLVVIEDRAVTWANALGEAPSSALIELSVKQATWSWYDVAHSFREIGYQVTESEKTIIMQALFVKKLKFNLEKSYGN